MSTHVFYGQLEKIISEFALILLLNRFSDNIIKIIHEMYNITCRALKILKAESVQPMTMTSSTSQFPKCYYNITCHKN